MIVVSLPFLIFHNTPQSYIVHFCKIYTEGFMTQLT